MTFKRTFDDKPDENQIHQEFTSSFECPAKVESVEENGKWVVTIHAEDFNEFDAEALVAEGWTKVSE